MREPLRWRTHFGSWVADISPTRVATELRAAGTPVTESAVYKWVAGERLPRPDVALHLVEISCGQISLADVYAHRVELHGVQVRAGAALGVA